MIVARISTVNGSCTLPGYNKEDDRWFIVESISFGFDQGHVDKKESKDGGKDFVVGQRNETTITINKALDAASCDLMFQAMNDRFIAKGKEGTTPVKADIHFIETLAHDLVDEKKAKSGNISYLRIAMETVKVKQWSISGSAEGRPTETVELWCEQLAMRFQRSVDGRVYKDAGMQGWNQQLGLQGNRKWEPDKSNKYYHAKYYPEW